MKKQYPIVLLIVCHCLVLSLYSQDRSSIIDNTTSLPEKFLNDVNSKAAGLESELVKQSDRAINYLAKQESRLQKKMALKDSVLAKQLFQETQSKYQSITTQLHQKATQLSKHKEYIPWADTIFSSVRYLNENENFKNNPLLAKTLGNITGLENRLQQVTQIQQYLRSRRDYLKQQYEKLGMTNQG